MGVTTYTLTESTFAIGSDTSNYSNIDQINIHGVGSNNSLQFSGGNAYVVTPTSYKINNTDVFVSNIQNISFVNSFFGFLDLNPTAGNQTFVVKPSTFTMGGKSYNYGGFQSININGVGTGNTFQLNDNGAAFTSFAVTPSGYGLNGMVINTSNIQNVSFISTGSNTNISFGTIASDLTLTPASVSGATATWNGGSKSFGFSNIQTVIANDSFTNTLSLPFLTGAQNIVFEGNYTGDFFSAAGFKLLNFEIITGFNNATYTLQTKDNFGVTSTVTTLPVGNFTLTNGLVNDTLSYGAVANGSSFNLGAGSNTILSLTGSPTISATNVSSITSTSGGASALTLNNTQTNTAINKFATVTLAAGTNSVSLSQVSTVNTSASDDSLTISNSLSGVTINLGTGNDSLVLANGGNTVTVTGLAGTETITGGTGTDNITLSDATNAVTLNNIESVSASAAGKTLTLNNQANGLAVNNFSTLNLANAVNTITPSGIGTINYRNTLNISLPNSSDNTILNTTATTSSINFGAGNNFVSRFTGATTTISGANGYTTNLTIGSSSSPIASVVGSAIFTNLNNLTIYQTSGISINTISTIKNLTTGTGAAFASANDGVLISAAVNGGSINLGSGNDSLDFTFAVGQTLVLNSGTSSDFTLAGNNNTIVSIENFTGASSGTNTFNINSGTTSGSTFTGGTSGATNTFNINVGNVTVTGGTSSTNIFNINTASAAGLTVTGASNATNNFYVNTTASGITITGASGAGTTNTFAFTSGTSGPSSATFNAGASGATNNLYLRPDSDGTADTFTLTTGSFAITGSKSATITYTGTTNIGIDFSQFTTGVTFDIGTRKASFAGPSGTVTDNWTGAQALLINQLLGSDTANDTFLLSSGASAAGKKYFGGGGSDTLDLRNATSVPAVVIDLINGTLVQGALTDTFQSIENFFLPNSSDVTTSHKVIASNTGGYSITGHNPFAGFIDQIDLSNISTAVTVNVNTSTNNVSWAGGTVSDTISGINRFIFSATKANDLTSKADFTTRIGFTNTPNGTVSQIHSFSYNSVTSFRDNFDVSAYTPGHATFNGTFTSTAGTIGNNGYTVQNNYIRFVQATNTDTSQAAGGVDVFIDPLGTTTFSASSKVAHTNFANILTPAGGSSVDDVNAYLNYLTSHTIISSSI